jgi:hypothetical protein
MQGVTKMALGGIAAALVFAGIVAGTAAIAMSGDDSGDAEARQELDEGGRQQAPADGGGVAAICLEGAEDCDDTIDSGGGFAMCAPDVDPEECEDVEFGDEPCPAEGCDPIADCQSTAEECIDTGGGTCPAGMACIEPWLMDPPVCPDGVSFEECFPDGVPLGYECVTMESFPVQVRCFPVECKELTPEEAARQAEAGDAPAGQARPAIARCLPVPECDDTRELRCLPPDCAVSSDGSVACPAEPGECVGGPAVDCLAPQPPAVSEPFEGEAEELVDPRE